MMKLDGDSAFLELDRSELGSLETPADQDVLLNVLDTRNQRSTPKHPKANSRFLGLPFCIRCPATELSVQVGSYSAADQCWIATNDLKRFLSELRELDASRQGQAVLLGASLDDLRLEFYSTDSVGHMGVKGHLGWNRSEEFPLQLTFGFGFEPDRLRSLLEYFGSMTCG